MEKLQESLRIKYSCVVYFPKTEAYDRFFVHMQWYYGNY